MPDDYYVSQYSGEEIDDLLGKAGSATGAVRYDAAQSLTAAQKTQARKNVNAAPGGYGLGDIAGVAISSTVEEGLNTATQNGWYYFGGTGDIENRPSLIPDSGYGYLLVSSRDQQTKLQVFMSEVNNYIAVRKLEAGVWQPWEYVNPPMQLGVEYRTTERFLGKPVYVKAIDFGAVAIGLNQVSFMSDVDRPIRCYAMLTTSNATIPWIGTPGTDQSFCSINGANARIQSTAAFPAGAVVFVGYYYKTNE